MEPRLSPFSPEQATPASQATEDPRALLCSTDHRVWFATEEAGCTLPTGSISEFDESTRMGSSRRLREPVALASAAMEDPRWRRRSVEDRLRLIHLGTSF